MSIQINEDIKVLSKEDIDQINDKEFPGNVVGIMNKFRIIISPGKSVFKVGDKIKVILPILEITNTETKSKEYFSFTKSELKITDVFDEYALAFSDETDQIQGLASVAVSLSSMANKKEIRELVVTDEDNHNLMLDDYTINIGDFISFR